MDNLRKEAKRWLKALRTNDPEARERFQKAYPTASGEPVLRDVQHALAREHGYENWTALKQALSRPKQVDLVTRFLEYACPDHHVRGLPAHRMMQDAAMRLLELNPDISRADIYTAVVCGEIQEVERLLQEQPQLASTKRASSGPDWEPLRFLCFTRLPLPNANDNAVAIAKLLIDHGADPNGHFMAGLYGEGEESRQPHPRRDELARLLVERGADANDDLAPADRDLANLHSETSPLFLLPADEDTAIEIARLFIAHGADPGFRNKEGSTAADVARTRGMHRLAELLERPGMSLAEGYQRSAQDFVAAYEGDAVALERLNQRYNRSFSFEDLRAEIWRRVYAFRQRSSRVPKNYLQLSEAQILVAQDAGVSSWEALMKAAAAGAPPQSEAYNVDPKGDGIGPARRMTGRDWDAMLAVLRERRITGVHGNGMMTDEMLARIADCDHVTRLVLGGSRELTDDGLRHLARMPQLEHLELSEYPGGKITDRGLEVLRHLPNLRTFEMTWQAGITDVGVANLRFCDKLENVNLMGSPTGDGAVEALQGKPRLRRFSTGRLVTDRALPLLHNFPLLKQPADGENGAFLLIDGPFTDAGLAGIAGLAGVAELDLFWHVSAVTADGFAHLRYLPNLQVLGCDGELSNDRAMVHIAAIPRLRRLRAQESTATDDGFVALAESKTLEGFWGRECPNFGNRAFIAFSKMPSLRRLGVGLKNVDDEALASLPDFPALQELIPIGLKDDGFRHVGRCSGLKRLTCMYCRESGDIATDFIGGLQISYYYAGLTKITDRSLEILGRMPSLEQIELYECNGVTDAGLPYLANMPNLREVHLDSLPGVTREGSKVFPAGVRVYYST
jgi:hypothetical protein